jgi:AhpD family alkylhydroperoxidase
VLFRSSSLGPQEQQVVYLAVSAFHGCAYCVAGHTYLGRQAALPEDAIAALRDGQPVPQPRWQALRVFTEAVLRSRGHAGDAALKAFFAAGYTQAQVLEVVTVIATKTISNYTNHLTHTPLEGFMADPALAWTPPV